jgi:hypothetical protein
MCRNIKVLRRPEQPPTPEEVSNAALQYVRKISGFHKPSKVNQEAFDRAVREIADASQRLLLSIHSARLPASSHAGMAVPAAHQA